ncbi:MAG: 16S rRNA (guanine(966)-N(2))-methyltransferase RsmD [Bacteroidetes bacterium]|jgi:16S rRNA (guanine(966)-N(2))-methyltransferase RsmD|nr:16S rRNA (guanine(966)-N(2))-methyltransferase RsmD [Bacteroidota bacterium]
MRIIAGKHKGLSIPMPKGGEIRPTTDRAKEALFSILTSRFDFEDITVLDLFAGSGNIGFEFVSRGCLHVTSVEKNRRVIKQSEEFTKSKNIEHMSFRCMDVFQYIKRCNDTYDVIFADPPYHLKTIQRLPELIQEQQLLNPKGLLIVEHESNLGWDTTYLVESRNYGQSVFSLFQFDVSLT